MIEMTNDVVGIDTLNVTLQHDTLQVKYTCHVRTFSSGMERREKGRVGNFLFTSLKNTRDDFTW